MKDRFKAILTIILITPLLTELLSGNLPPAIFFQPQIIFFTVIIYGLAVLIIRELAVRWNLGIEGIFIFGLAYGIYNEGICAKTLIMTEYVPMPVFNSYPLLLGINVPWAVFILPWHALHAVVYPILIVALVYPRVNNLNWLSGKYYMFFMFIVVAAGVLGFFVMSNSAAFIYLPVFIILIILLVLLSKSGLIPRNLHLQLPAQKVGFKPAILGFSFIIYFIGLMILGGMKAPVFLSCIYAGLTIFIFYRVIKSAKWLSLEAGVLFALGNFTADALFLLLGGFVKQSTATIVIAVIFIIIFAICIFKIKKNSGILSLIEKSK